MPFAFFTAASGTVLGLLSLFAPSSNWQIGLLVLAGALVMLGSATYLVANLGHKPRIPRVVRPHISLLKFDHTPHFVTDKKGQVLFQNGSSSEKLGPVLGRSMASILGDLSANPEAVVYRLQSRAGVAGAAQEDVQNRRKKFRLAVQAIGKSFFVWRFEDIASSQTEESDRQSLIPRISIAPNGDVREYNTALASHFSSETPPIEEQLKNGPLASGTVRQFKTVNGSDNFLLARHDGGSGGCEIFLQLHILQYW